ncbi:MAG TPA: lipoprotein signal peptidase [Campylobacterales bacterium]|nr:lipoprotein signal peptidase [Campylobacterales bacterium]HIP42002.1 lipoprotein signal peptidase [Campylobacterales bacterium]
MMSRPIVIFLLVALGTFIIDQNIKTLFVEGGYYLEGSCINLELHYNKGVAFSIFASLGAYLKWIQVVLIIGIIIYVFYEGYIKEFAFPIGLIVGGAIGNLYDRFNHEGVVDYVAWHCGFDFAVFNYADVMIDLGVALILLFSFLESRKSKKIG